MKKLIKPILIALTLIVLSVDVNAQTTNNAYGDNQIEIEPGVFALFSGDLNQDGFVDIFDYPIYDYDNLNFASGYVVSDINGDGFVDIFDFPIFDANNLSFVSSVKP